MSHFAQNWQLVETKLAQTSVMPPLKSVSMKRFLELYFKNPNLLKVYAELATHIASYRTARDLLVSQGNGRVLPGVTNGYVFLATLLYGAGEVEAGDRLTRDYLCVLLRTLNKPGARRHYVQSEFHLRAGLRATRDLVAFHRLGGKSKFGFKGLRQSEFPFASFGETLQKDFVERMGCHKDIINGKKVNLYNLSRQLDNWANSLTTLPSSNMAPGFAHSELFTNEKFANELGVRKVK